MEDEDYLEKKGEKVERHVFRAVAFLCRGTTNEIASSNSVANLAKFTLRNHRTGPYIDDSINDCIEHLAFSGKIVRKGRGGVKLAKPYKNWDIRKLDKSKWASKLKLSSPIDDLDNGVGDSSTSSSRLQIRRYTLKGCDDCGLRNFGRASHDSIISSSHVLLNPKRTDYRLNVHSVRNELSVYNLGSVLRHLQSPQITEWNDNVPAIKNAYVDSAVQTDERPPSTGMSRTEKILKWLFC